MLGLIVLYLRKIPLSSQVGNYNVLLQGCSSALYDTSCTWEESHETFHHAFAAFPWEVVLSQFMP